MEWRSENGGVPWASMDMEMAARGLRSRAEGTSFGEQRGDARLAVATA